MLFLTFFYDSATFYTMYDSCTNLELENMVTGYQFFPDHRN